MPALKSKIRNYIKAIFKKDVYFKIQKKVKVEWLGNNYGGFYVSIDGLSDKSVIYSFGVGEDIIKDMIDED